MKLNINDDGIQPFPIAFEKLQTKVENIEQPASKEAADDADDEVNHEAHAFSFEKKAAQPAGQCADNNESNNFGR